MLCKNCSEIIDDNSIFCKFCGHRIESHKPWNIIICKDDSLWNENIFENSPSIIAHEYYRIKELLMENQTYGAMMQVKDLLEVILKFPIVIELSRLNAKPDKTEDDYKFLGSLLEKPLNL